MTTITPATLARALAAALERRTRAGGETFTALRDGSPEWMTAACLAAHDAGEFFPDDFRYRRIHEAAELMSEIDPDAADFAADVPDTYSTCDVYTSDRLAWLASNLRRVEYCDTAAEEWGEEACGDIVRTIGFGQEYESREIWHQLAAFLIEEAQRQAAAADAVPA